MKKKKNRIVILTGAGFPMIWNAPTSYAIYSKIVDIIRTSELPLELRELLLSKEVSFESILAIIEQLIFVGINKINNEFQSHFITSTCLLGEKEIDNLYLCYANSINLIIDQIHEYEILSLQSNNQSLKELWNTLISSYEHVNYYTTNYDEVIPNLITNVKNTEELFDSVQNHHEQKCTSSNLHGSIHLKMGAYNNGQYEIEHSNLVCYLDIPINLYGGNPSEIKLFTPIITGIDKSQRILSKRFINNFINFANDLNYCDTLLIMGYSFSDPHINMLLRQYTIGRDVNFIIVTKQHGRIYGSQFENHFNNVIVPSSTYDHDTFRSHWYKYNTPNLYVYKKGVEKFLKLKKSKSIF